MSTPKANGGNVQPWAPRHRVERGAPTQSRFSLAARAFLERCKVTQSPGDILAVAAALLFCLSGPLIIAGVTAIYIIRRGS